MKCKPTYQFQSIEFEWEIIPEVDEDIQLQAMFKTYEKVLKGLIKISPVQDTKQVHKPAEPLATDRQKEIMDTYGIKYTATTTQKEAYEKIKKSMDQ